jgi:tetratricopeptide (TPR) repeat protein
MTPEERLAQRKDICDGANQLYASGESMAAAEQFQKCLTLFNDDEKASVEWGNFCLGYGSALTESSNLQLASTMFHSAISTFLPLGKPGELGTAYFNLGNVAANSGSLQDAYDNFTLGLKTFRKASLDRGAAQCLLNLVSMFFGMGVPARAREFLEEFDQLDPAIRQDPEIGRSYWMQRARSEMFDSRMADAKNSLEKALELAIRTGIQAYIVETESSLAQAKAALGEGPDAIGAIEKAYEQARLANSPRAIDAAAAFAAALEQRGEAGRALDVYRFALERVEQIRAQLDLSDRFRFMESASRIARSATRLLFGIKEYGEAFEVSERGQARTTLDLMFRHQIRRQGSRGIRAAVNGRAILDSPSLATVQEDVDQSGIHLLKLYRGDHDLLAWFLKPGEPMDAWDASEALEPMESLMDLLLRANLKLDSFEEQSTLMEVRGGVPKGRPLWSEIDEAMQVFWVALIQEEVRGRFEDRSGRLVICPHRETWFVPFGAARLKDGSALCSRWELALAPSAGAFLQLDQRRDPGDVFPEALDPGALAIGGCSSQALSVPLVPGQPEPVLQIGFHLLPNTSVEAGRVVQLLGGKKLIGPEATPGAVVSLMEKFRVLHIASHGFWDPSGDISLVLLESGCLTSNDAARRTLHCELTVLSACQTGLGMPHPDSYTGLTQSFLIGGCRSVLSTLWPVDDSATLYFMEVFYGALKKSLSPAKALVRAQAAVRENPDLSDGYNWAGFHLAGRPFGSDPIVSGGKPFEGPVFCGGDLVLMGTTPGEVIDFTPCRDAIQRSSEALIFRNGQMDKIDKPHAC